MNKLITSFYKLLDIVVAGILLLMTIFVFSNIVARYVFGQSLGWSDEASRYLYIWLIFLGALIAYRENNHLGVDMFVQKCSVKGKKILYVVNNIIIIFVLGLFLVGIVQYVLLTVDQFSPALDLPLAYVYVSGLISIAGMTIITATHLYRFFTHQVTEEQLILISGEDEDQVKEATKGNIEKGADQE